MQAHANRHRLLIWDLPTRVFHWLLVASFATAWISFDDNRYLDVHVYAGYLFFSLLIFRLIWGAVGSRHARFRAFAYDWPSVWAYLRGLLNGQAARHLGHNPAGAWAIFAMLALGLAVSLAGILVLGGEEGHGPLRGFLPFAVGTAAKAAHQVLAWSMLALVALHIAGVVVESFVHKENLIWAMIAGHKETAIAGGGVSRHGVVGVLILAAAFGYTAFYFRGYLTQTPERPHLPFQGPALPDNATWRQECGDCHLAFYPVLLPARSWQKLMAEQGDHFGEDLSLDAATVTEITDFLMAHAAERGLTEAGRKINASIPAGDTPLRITDTPYWRRKHAEIDAAYWQDKKIGGKGQCGACHLDAKQGTFEDSAMRLPPLSKN